MTAKPGKKNCPAPLPQAPVIYLRGRITQHSQARRRFQVEGKRAMLPRRGDAPARRPDRNPSLHLLHAAKGRCPRFRQEPLAPGPGTLLGNACSPIILPYKRWKVIPPKVRAPLDRNQLLQSARGGGEGQPTSIPAHEPPAEGQRFPYARCRSRDPVRMLTLPAGKENNPFASRVPVQPPRLGAQVPVQTARGRLPSLIRPLPVPTNLASKPIGHCKQR